MQKSSILALAAATAAAIFTGCLASPKNNDSVANKFSSVLFQGYYPSTPNVVITVKALNLTTNQWDVIGPPLKPGTTPASTDSTGMAWYEFSGNVTLPSGQNYWKKNGLTQQISVQAGGGQYPTLFTFEGGTTGSNNTLTCYQKFQSEGGVAVAENCHSATSPTVLLNVGCGASQQDCCPGGICNNYFTCDSSFTCGGCGKELERCCHTGTGPVCAPGLTCAANDTCRRSCTTTGPKGPDADCVATATTCYLGLCQPRACVNGKCGLNQACNANNLCISIAEPCNCGSIGNMNHVNGRCCLAPGTDGEVSIGCGPGCLDTGPNPPASDLINLGCCGNCTSVCQ